MFVKTRRMRPPAVGRFGKASTCNKSLRLCRLRSRPGFLVGTIAGKVERKVLRVRRQEALDEIDDLGRIVLHDPRQFLAFFGRRCREAAHLFGFRAIGNVLVITQPALLASQQRRLDRSWADRRGRLQKTESCRLRGARSRRALVPWRSSRSPSRMDRKILRSRAIPSFHQNRGKSRRLFLLYRLHGPSILKFFAEIV